MSRRLSHGSGVFLGNPLDDDEEEVEIEKAFRSSMSSRTSMGGHRRRSSVGGGAGLPMGSPLKTGAEQSRIADMYKLVIKMSSENVRIFLFVIRKFSNIVVNPVCLQKINEKNSWSFDLIDHMGRLIRDEGKGINFQKVFSPKERINMTRSLPFCLTSGELYPGRLCEDLLPQSRRHPRLWPPHPGEFEP